MKFDQENWHDSQLKAFRWRCSDSGEDKVIFDVDYIVEYESNPRTERRSLEFDDARRIALSANLGIIAEESILEGSVKNNGHLYDEFVEAAGKLGIDPKDYRVYRLDLNSSGGWIEVVAKGYRWL